MFPVMNHWETDHGQPVLVTPDYVTGDGGQCASPYGTFQLRNLVKLWLGVEA